MSYGGPPPHDGLQPDGPHRDVAKLRISDADRHKVAELLREAAGDGRLDLDELDERLEATYAAKTYADLVPITIDLPTADVSPLAETMPVKRGSRDVVASTITHSGSLAIMGETKRRGAWLINDGHTAVALMGSVEIDLREATFGNRSIVINAHAVMGEVKILIDEYTQVRMSGVPIMGEFSQGKDRTPANITADSPTIDVRGMALMGSVNVVRVPPPGTPKKFLGTY